MSAADNAQALFDQCMADSGNPRQRTSLERIHKACDYLDKENIRITPGAVERYCAEHQWNGPKAQSIRNSPTLYKYLRLRGEGQIVKASITPARPLPMIHDESLRAYVNLLREERDQAKADKTRIVKGVRSIPGIDVENLIRVGFGGTASAPRQEVRLTPVVVDALTRLFNDQILSDCGLKMRKNRLINDLTGNVLLTKEHLEAVRALVESDSAPLAGSNQPFPMMGLEKTSTLDPEE